MTATTIEAPSTDSARTEEQREAFADLQRQALEAMGLPRGDNDELVDGLFGAAKVSQAVLAAQLANRLVAAHNGSRSRTLKQLHRLNGMHADTAKRLRALRSLGVFWNVAKPGHLASHIRGSLFLLKRADSDARVATALGVVDPPSEQSLQELAHHFKRQ